MTKMTFVAAALVAAQPGRDGDQYSRRLCAGSERRRVRHSSLFGTAVLAEHRQLTLRQVGSCDHQRGGILKTIELRPRQLVNTNFHAPMDIGLAGLNMFQKRYAA